MHEGVDDDDLMNVTAINDGDILTYRQETARQSLDGRNCSQKTAAPRCDLRQHSLVHPYSVTAQSSRRLKQQQAAILHSGQRLELLPYCLYKGAEIPVLVQLLLQRVNILHRGAAPRHCITARHA